MPYEDPSVGAGELDRRVTLLQPVYANEYEDEIVDWQSVADVWANVDPAASSEIDEAGRVVSRVTVPIVIRYRTDIDARWRVQDRDQIYQIRSIADVARRHVRLALACEQVL
jgi:SPP1 family predicted phage head-tail adaptor